MPAKRKPATPGAVAKGIDEIVAQEEKIAALRRDQRHAEAMCAAACGSWVGAAEAVSKMARDYAEAAKDDGIGARTADALVAKACVCVEEAKAKNAAARSQEADFEKAVEGRVEVARQEWAYLAETERKSASMLRDMLDRARLDKELAENAREMAKLEAEMTRESKHYWGFCGLVLGAAIAAMLGALLP